MNFVQPFTTLQKHRNVPTEEDERPGFDATNYLNGAQYARSFGFLTDQDEDDIDLGKQNGGLNGPKEPRPSRDDDVSTAYQNVIDALEATKTPKGTLNDILMDDPERPELDTDQIDRGKKLTRTAALLQAIDAIASGASLAAQGDNSISAPIDYSDMGLAGLNKIIEAQDEHKMDLDEWTRRNQDVDRFNTQLRQDVNQQNANIDLQKAEMDYRRAQDVAQREIDQEEMERLAGDDQASQHYEIGVRAISQGNFALAEEHFKIAGLSNEATQRIVANGKSQSKTEEATGFLSPELESLGVKKRDKYLYNRYKQYEKQVSDEDYPVDSATGQVLFEEDPKRGTPSWHLKRLEDDLGAKFYLIDDFFEENQPTGEEGGSSDDPTTRFTNVPGSGVLRREYQPFNNKIDIQTTLAESNTLADKIRRGKATEQDFERWEQNFTRLAYSQGRDEEEIERLKLQAFEEMGVTGSPDEPAKQNFADQTSQEQTGRSVQPEERQVPIQAGMGSGSDSSDNEMRGVAETLLGPVGGALAKHVPKIQNLNTTNQLYKVAKGIYDQFKNSGVQIRSRQDQRLQEMYGDDWKPLINQMKSENPNVSEDYLRYLLIEAPNSELIPENDG